MAKSQPSNTRNPIANTQMTENRTPNSELKSLESNSIASRVPRREVVNADWLIKLRWVAVIGQFITIFCVISVLKIQLEVISLGIILCVTAVSNFFLELWHRRFLKKFADQMSSSEINLVLGLVMTLDLLSLTALLYSSGGPTNPFSLFFFVNLSLSAFVLTNRWSWSLNLLSVFCYCVLLYSHIDIPELNVGDKLKPVRSSGVLTLPQAGMLIAFTTCSSVIVYFVTRLNSEVRLQGEALRIAEAREAETEKLQALGTLAAGAAHELSTPLSTISVVVNELQQLIKKQQKLDQATIESDSLLSSSVLSEDVALIKEELDRCRGILTKLSADAGQSSGEPLQHLSVKDFAEYVISELPINLQYAMELSDEDAVETFIAPLTALGFAIGGIIKNAFDAQLNTSSSEIKFHLKVIKTKLGKELVWQILDSGSGMTPDILRRMREPFFTTKEPGKGMGLGVFLAYSTIERLGGRLSYESEPGMGTTATLTLPMKN